MDELSQKQARFFKCFNDPVTLDMIMDEAGVGDLEFAEWLDDETFSRTLDRQNEVTRIKGKLEVLRGAAHSARRMAQCAYGNNTALRPVQRLVWKDFMRAADIMVNRQNAAQILGPHMVQNLLHPDVLHRADEVMDKLAAARVQAREERAKRET